jgi:hypothetical protein
MTSEYFVSDFGMLPIVVIIITSISSDKEFHCTLAASQEPAPLLHFCHVLWRRL